MQLCINNELENHKEEKKKKKDHTPTEIWISIYSSQCYYVATV